MNLLKALKEKNKRAKKLSTLIDRIRNNNVFDEGATPAYDAKALLESLRHEINQFSDFKASLFNATVDIRKKIFLISELKNAAEKLRLLGCETGISAYGSRRRRVASDQVEGVPMVASISEVDRDQYIESLEGEIEKLQDEIDYFNATKVL